MPIIIGMLWGGLVSILGSLVGRVLVALAISYVTYSGVSVLIESLKTAAFANLGNMGPLVGVVGMMKLGECVSVIVSAVVAKYTIGGLTNGSVTKMVFKK
jgi:hypothetical protein